MIFRRDLYRIYAKTYKVSIKYSKSVIDSVFDLMTELIYKDGEDVQIRGFGTFRHRIRSPQLLRHPRTGKLVMSKEMEVVSFSHTTADFSEKNEWGEET